MKLLKVTIIICLALGMQVIGIGSASSIELRSQTLMVNGHSIQLQVPVGLRLEFLANLSNPRFLTMGPGQEFIIGSRGTDIHRMTKPYGSPELLVRLTGRNHSVAYRDGKLFVAETAGLYVADYTGPATMLDDTEFELLVSLPSQTGGHWSRTVIVGPDNRLYISLGISGNCSDEYLHNSYPFERRRGGLFLLNETGASPQLVPYASGLRNPIGIAFRPGTNTIFATNAGPDNLGYGQPPEVFTALSQGSFHGMPWFQYYNGAFRSGECAINPAPRPSNDATPPDATFEARSTPEGIAFVTNGILGNGFIGNALVAIHGSWAVPPGGGPETRRPPKIVMVTFNGDQPSSVEDIVTGFQRDDGSRFARPCGMLMGSDGLLYFTSDAGDVTGLFRLRPIPLIAPLFELLQD